MLSLIVAERGSTSPFSVVSARAVGSTVVVPTVEIDVKRGLKRRAFVASIAALKTKPAGTSCASAMAPAALCWYSRTRAGPRRRRSECSLGRQPAPPRSRR